MADPTPTATQRCTSILLHAFMDYMHLPDVLQAMSVNQDWRAQAMNHRTYYGDLKLTDSEDSPSSVELFLLRMSRSASRPISVSLDLRSEPPPNVFPEIARHFTQITSFELYLRQNSEDAVAPTLALLSSPAPILRKLTLHFSLHSFSRPTAALSDDFLGGYAPALAKVFLFGISFPAVMPVCFSNISSLAVGAFGGDIVMPNPFPRCQKLRELDIRDGVRLDTSARLSRDGWDRLSHLTLNGDTLASWRALRIALTDVGSIQLDSADGESISALADTISGAVQVKFWAARPRGQPRGAGMHEHCTVTFDSASRHESRLRHIQGSLTEPVPLAVFATPSLTDRVARIILPLHLWDDYVALRAFGPFNALEELILTLSYGDNLPPAPSAKLSCPHLQQLALRGSQRPGVNNCIHMSESLWAYQKSTMDVCRLSTFALAALPDAVFPLKLELDGVELTGLCDAFDDTFSSRVERDLSCSCNVY